MEKKIMTKKTKSKNETNILENHAEEIGKDILQAIDKKREAYDMPNYLVEYIALRHITDQYESYIQELLEVGSTDKGGLDVGYS